MLSQLVWLSVTLCSVTKR